MRRPPEEGGRRTQSVVGTDVDDAMSDRIRSLAWAEAGNAMLAGTAPAQFARFVGAPVVHAAIAGSLECPLPDLPFMTYRGRYQGGAMVADAHGRILARREGAEGSGWVAAEIELAPHVP